MMLSPPTQPGSPQLSEAIMIDYARRHSPYIERDTPNLYEEMQGIAEGAGVGYDTILTLNCVAEVRRLRTPGVLDNLRKQDESPRGCTCYAVQGALSGGEVYIGQTYDIEPLWTPIVFHHEAHGEEPEQLMVGHAGIMCEFGLNAAGIGFVASAIMVTDQRVGLPAPVMGRLILGKTRLSQAAGALVAARRTIGIHYILASKFGVMDVETSSSRHVVAYVQDEAFVCANHIHAPHIAEIGMPQRGYNSFMREGRLTQLLRSATAPVSWSHLKSCMQDHADHPLSICAHTEPGLSTCESRCAVILKPAEGAMMVTDGTPCSHPFEEIRMTGETRPQLRVA